MIRFKARVYSGKDTAAIESEIVVDEHGVLHSSNQAFEPIPILDLTLSSRIGNGARYLRSADGLIIESNDNTSIDLLEQNYFGRHKNLAYRLESNGRIIVLSIVVLIIGLYGFFTVGIPAASGTITDALPVAFDDRLGGELLERLDEIVFEPSQLSSSRQQSLRSDFEDLVQGLDRDFVLQFRSSESLGANAFALPDGQIVFTDQLIQLADNDDMLISIMLHEIGHVHFRHSMQAAVRQAGVSAALVVLTGDVNSLATTLLILLPAFLIQSQYSREFEWEADGYALDQMLARGIDTGNFADIMEKMTSYAGDVDGETNPPADSSDAAFSEYFSTHPATQARIERFRRAQ